MAKKSEEPSVLGAVVSVIVSIVLLLALSKMDNDFGRGLNRALTYAVGRESRTDVERSEALEGLRKSPRFTRSADEADR